MKGMIFAGALALAAVSPAALPPEAFDGTLIYAVTDKANPVAYAPGEEIVFRLRLADAPEGLEGGGYAIRWTRRGDDGAVREGRIPLDGATPLEVRTSLAKPGGVTLAVELVDAAGQPVKRSRPHPDYPGWERGTDLVRLFAGALVQPEKLVQAHPEPEDFDAVWARQKRRLADVPLRADVERLGEAQGGAYEVFKFRIDCPGPRPVTGFMTRPKGAKPRSCKLAGMFQGYGDNPQGRLSWGLPDTILFEINAHGYELERQPEYYDAFRRGVRTPDDGYGFSAWQNEYPEGCYFNGMALRLMRAYEYFKTLPEWNGRDVEASGGSQGGLQTLWAAGLVDGITAARATVPWCCDLGAEAAGRDVPNWRIRWTKGISYYDPVNHARRAKCPVRIDRAGLGDTGCLPNSIAVLYNNLARGGSVNWVQNSTHGYVPRANLQSVELPGGRVVRAEAGRNVFTGDRMEGR